MSRKICKGGIQLVANSVANCHHSDSYGKLWAYDKIYDRVTTKTERPLHLLERIKYNTTTSDDPIIQQASVFTFSCSQLY